MPVSIKYVNKFRMGFLSITTEIRLTTKKKEPNYHIIIGATYQKFYLHRNQSNVVAVFGAKTLQNYDGKRFSNLTIHSRPYNP